MIVRFETTKGVRYIANPQQYIEPAFCRATTREAAHEFDTHDAAFQFASEFCRVSAIILSQTIEPK